MKRFLTAVACLAVLFSLTACVPTENSISVGPDLTPNDNVEFDFTQLHNDTVSQFEGLEPYAFITDADITGSNEDRMVYIKAVCYDDVTEDIAAAFAAAALNRVNDAACIQDMTLTTATTESFGSFWDRFGVEIKVYTETEAAKEEGTPVYELKLAPGEKSDLDTNVAGYEEDWERQMEILQRNEE